MKSFVVTRTYRVTLGDEVPAAEEWKAAVAASYYADIGNLEGTLYRQTDVEGTPEWVAWNDLDDSTSEPPHTSYSVHEASPQVTYSYG